MKRIGVVIAAIVVALVLGVLLSPPIPANPVISALDRPAMPADAVPDGVPRGSNANFTTRLLATQDGIRYFVSQTEDASSTCLTIYPEQHAQDWTTQCSIGGDKGKELIRAGVAGLVTAVLIPDDFDAVGLVREGFVPVHHNIYVRPGHWPAGLPS